MTDKPLAYWDYIKVEELLDLQGGLAGSDYQLANDEVMFIVIHQIEELWFKLALRELTAARDLFARGWVPDDALASVVRGLDRATSILRHAAEQLGVMESMTTRDYLSFRSKLYPASGFQSAQLRELEILLGLSTEDRLPLGHESYMQALRNYDDSESPASLRVRQRLEDTPSLLEAMTGWLYRTPIDGSRPDMPHDEEVVLLFIDRFCEASEQETMALGARAASLAQSKPDRERLEKRYEGEVTSARAHLMAEDIDPPDRAQHRRVRAALLFIESYRELPLLAWPRMVLDSVVALEQAFVIFRQRHARMVERVIGHRTGTGGSSGVAYLDQTALKYRIFRDVWATRTLLVRQSALPPLKNAHPYAFACSPVHGES